EKIEKKEKEEKIEDEKTTLEVIGTAIIARSSVIVEAPKEEKTQKPKSRELENLFIDEGAQRLREDEEESGDSRSSSRRIKESRSASSKSIRSPAKNDDEPPVGAQNQILSRELDNLFINEGVQILKGDRDKSGESRSSRRRINETRSRTSKSSRSPAKKDNEAPIESEAQRKARELANLFLDEGVHGQEDGEETASTSFESSRSPAKEDIETPIEHPKQSKSRELGNLFIDEGAQRLRED
ncbi:hypothetical protein PFISCL1PPCAC_27176, partial [Pristionchus fissidentatus]